MNTNFLQNCMLQQGDKCLCKTSGYGKKKEGNDKRMLESTPSLSHNPLTPPLLSKNQHHQDDKSYNKDKQLRNTN